MSEQGQIDPIISVHEAKHPQALAKGKPQQRLCYYHVMRALRVDEFIWEPLRIEQGVYAQMVTGYVNGRIRDDVWEHLNEQGFLQPIGWSQAVVVMRDGEHSRYVHFNYRGCRTPEHKQARVRKARQEVEAKCDIPNMQETVVKIVSSSIRAKADMLNEAFFSEHNRLMYGARAEWMEGRFPAVSEQAQKVRQLQAQIEPLAKELREQSSWLTKATCQALVEYWEPYLQELPEEVRERMLTKLRTFQAYLSDIDL